MLYGEPPMKTLPKFSTGNKIRFSFILLVIALILVVWAGLCFGSTGGKNPVRLFMEGPSSVSGRILLYVRLPRTLGAIFAGAALAASGTILQAVLNNPLAAPNIIGVNAGAGLGIVLLTALFPAAAAFAPAAAFIGAFCSVMLVLGIAMRTGASRLTLILAGVVVSSFFSALIDTVTTLVPDALSGYSSFRIGGLSGISMQRIIPAGIVILICLAAVILLSSELDILMLGSDTAQSLGMNVRLIRIVFLSLAAALAGAAVSFSGLIGFIGIIVPNFMRRIAGDENRVLLPASMLGGSLLLSLCDLLSRVLFSPYEISVGIILALLGSPFFAVILLNQRKGRTHD